MMLMLWPLGGVVVPPVRESATVETPLTTVTERVVVVDVSKFDESVGVNVAVSDTDPRDAGVHEHEAEVDEADADPQPLIVVPPSMKLTEPARGTVAVIVTAPPNAALSELLGKAIVIDVEAFVTVIIICFIPDCGEPALSVAITLSVYVPAAVVESTETIALEILMPAGVEDSVNV